MMFSVEKLKEFFYAAWTFVLISGMAILFIILYVTKGQAYAFVLTAGIAFLVPMMLLYFFAQVLI